MYNQDEIEDSIEFCKDIQVYYEPMKREETKRTNPYLNQPYIQNNYPSYDIDISEINKKKKERFYIGIGKKLLQLVICIVIAFLLAKGITKYIGQYTKVEGISMENVLHDGDYIIINKISYRFHNPERFDIIVFPFDADTYYIKRIIGLPGEKIQVIDGLIYIDGLPLKESYGTEEIRNPANLSQEIQLGKKEYFVLGDNRNQSTDSRFDSVGMISEDRIIGKALAKVYPFDSIDLLEHY